MSDRRHTWALLAERLADVERQQQRLDQEKTRIYAAAKAAGLARPDLRLMASRARDARRKRLIAKSEAAQWSAPAPGGAP